MANMFDELKDKIEQHPAVSALVVIGSVIIIYFVFINNKNVSGTSGNLVTTPPIATPPITSPINTGVTSGVPVVAPVSTTQLIAHIRAKTTSGLVAGYDKTHTGVPLRSAPSGSASTLSYIPFGSTVTVYSNDQYGGINPKVGSSGWYQVVSGGWVSDYDVAYVG